MKKLMTMAALLLAAAPAMAQYEGTEWYDRIGLSGVHGQDSVEVRQNLSMFNENFKAKNYKDAYEHWDFVIKKVPVIQTMVYTRGWTMLTALIKGGADKAEKKKFLDEMMWMHDTRIKNLAALNSFAKNKKEATGEGAIRCRKAYDYFTHANGVYDDFSLDKAHALFNEGIEMVNADATHEVEGWVLETYFICSYQKFMQDPEGFREQFIKDYLMCKEVCEKMLEHANQEPDAEAAQKIVAQYDPVLVRVNDFFSKSNAADRDWLIAYYTPKVEENKGDINFLRSAINILANNDCDDADVYFKASKYAYDIEPSFASAIGIAQQLTKQKQDAESIQYYDKAIELCPDNKTKARIAMKVVYALAKSGNGTKAEGYLQKVETFDPTMTGRTNLFRAQNAATSKNYSAAISYATKAAEADPAISGTANRLKTRIQEYQRRQAEYDTANAEYKKQLEKQQKLENFWKGQ